MHLANEEKEASNIILPWSYQSNNTNRFPKDMTLECIHRKRHRRLLSRIQFFSKISIVLKATSNIILQTQTTNNLHLANSKSLTVNSIVS